MMKVGRSKDGIYQEGLRDASRAIAKHKVKNLEEKRNEREEKCTDGDVYSCGAEVALHKEAERLRTELLKYQDAQRGCMLYAKYDFLENAAGCAKEMEEASDFFRFEVKELDSPGIIMSMNRYMVVMAPDQALIIGAMLISALGARRYW